MSLERVYIWARHLPTPARALLRLLANRYFEPRGYPLTGPLAGCRMHSCRALGAYLEGSYEPQVCDTILRVVQPGWLCVDVGAHIGYFALLLAKLVGEHGRVIAFEAHPENAERLRSNVRMNGYEDWVQVENMAVTDGACRSAELFAGPTHSSFEWGTIGDEVQVNATQSGLQVAATSLDAYFPPRSRVDFIKMDIEGAEVEALRGMRRVLREWNPLVLLELHYDSGLACKQELVAAEYYPYDILNDRWLDRELDMQGVQHCLAVPRDRRADIAL